MNVLFYSKKSKLSYNVVKTMQGMDILKYFKCICVDDNIDKIPKMITTIPTLIVKEYPKPFIAEEIFNYLRTISFMRNQTSKPKDELIEQKVEEKKDKPLLGYVESEMNGFSDTFAFKDIDLAIPHKFIEYGNEDKYKIFTAPQEPKEMNMNETRQKKKLRDFMKTREEEDEKNKQIMKEKQLYALYMTEKK